MSAEEILKHNETAALKGGDFVANVNGKNKKNKVKLSGRWKSLGATGLLTAIIVVVAVLISSENIPSGISERLAEETDVQYADAVASRALVFQQALIEGDIPDDTAMILKRKGVLVGYEDGGEFVETNKRDGELSLMIDKKVIGPNDFISELKDNWKLYDAFNMATYSRVAYYYDDSAYEVFKKIGTNRNNFNGKDSFDNVINRVLGEGSDIDVNTVYLAEKSRKNEQTGETEVYYEYETNGNDANSDSKAGAFVTAVGEKNRARSENEATINSADALSVADTVSKEQRSSLLLVIYGDYK